MIRKRSRGAGEDLGSIFESNDWDLINAKCLYLNLDLHLAMSKVMREKDQK